MNPADMEQIKLEMAARAAALRHHEKQFTAMEVALRETLALHNQHLENLSSQLQQLKHKPLHHPPVLLFPLFRVQNLA